MVGKKTIAQLQGMLDSVRVQIDALEAAVKEKPHDRELRKRVKEAKIQESVFLANLSKWTMK